MLGPSYQYLGIINRVIDGDTYEVMVDLGFNIIHVIHVRLRDFDTAELRSKVLEERVHAQSAKQFVEGELPFGSKVVLTTAKSGIYNRWVADVWYINNQGKQVSLKDVLAANGFAKRSNYGA